jgi:hypothetical protein
MRLVLGCVVVLLLGLGNCPAHATVVAHWTFDETTGTIAHDNVGTFDGTLQGGAAFAPGSGIAGGAISFPYGLGGTVDMGDVLGFTSGDFSINAWVKTTRTDNLTFPIAKHWAGDVNGYALGLNWGWGRGATGLAYFFASAQIGGDPMSTTMVTDGQWHQVVGVYHAGGNREIYVDGAPAEDTKLSVPVIGNSAHLCVGGVSSGGSPWNLYEGLIDDVQIYDHALTSNEVQWLYEHPGLTLVIARVPSLSGVGLLGLTVVLILLGALVIVRRTARSTHVGVA